MLPLFATAYLPPISYVAELMKHDEVAIEQMETYKKQTYRNRALIATANGAMPLIVPVVKTQGNHTMTRDMTISYTENWPTRHQRTIKAAYSASPYYMYYCDEMDAILNRRYERLIDLNNAMTAFVLKKLKIGCKTTLTDDFAEMGACKDDFRNDFSIKQQPKTEQFPEYSQVFSAKMDFIPDLSIIDLLFNLGPDAKRYLINLGKQ